MADAKLWVDDERPAPEGWVWVKDVESARAVLRWDNVAELSLDHDLGNGPTGYVLAETLEQWWQDGGWKRDKVPVVLRCHSSNPAGRARIEAIFKRIEQWRSKIDDSSPRM